MKAQKQSWAGVGTIAIAGQVLPGSDWWSSQACSLSGVRLSAKLDAKISLLEEWQKDAEQKERGHAGAGGDSESGLEGTICKWQGWGTLSHHLPSALPFSSWGPWPALPPELLLSSCPTRCSLKKKKKGKKAEDAAIAPQSKQIVLL